MINIQVGSIHLRIAQIFLPFLILFIKKHHIEKKYIFLLFFLIFTAIPSIFVSSNSFKSILYLIWILYNSLFIFYFFYCLSKSSPLQILNSYINIVRVFILISFLIFLINGFERVALLFYEPSFFVLFIIPFIAWIFFSKSKNKIIDFTLILMFYTFTKSALFLVIFTFIFILWASYHIKLFLGFLIFILSILIFYEIKNFEFLNSDDINLRVLGTFLSTTEGIEVLLFRGGNRWPRFLQSLDVAYANYLIGVGIGAYEDFQLAKGGYDYSDLEVNIPEEDRGFGKPAVNVFLEMIATAGFCFLCVFLYFISSCFSKRIFKSQFRWFGIGVILIIVALQFESNFMRLYLWAFLGILLGLKDFVKNERI